MSTDRRDDVLHAALTVFGRYGYRKTSVDEVARAAQISRPGLYLYFSSKDILFRAAIQRELDTALHEATGKLHDPDGTLTDRMVDALDAWFGRYVGSSTAADIGDLVENSEAQLGTLFAEYRTTFIAALAKAIPQRNGIKAADIAASIYATGNGWRRDVETRTEFVRKLTVATRLIFGA